MDFSKHGKDLYNLTGSSGVFVHIKANRTTPLNLSSGNAEVEYEDGYLYSHINGSSPDLEALLKHSFQDRDTFQKLYKNLELYVVPLIFATGIVGNLVSFTVFVGTYLKRNSCNIYLASLAVADTVFMICMLLSWGKNIGYSFYNYQGSCQVMTYLTDISRFLSVWYVVAFTLERWIVTCHPLKRDAACTPKNARCVVIILALVALLAYSFSIFTYGASDLLGFAICSPLPNVDRIVYIIDNVDTVISLIIPTVIIVGCNIRMYHLIYKFQKQNGELSNVSCSESIQKWSFSKQSCSTSDHNTPGRKSPMVVGESPLCVQTQRRKFALSRTSHMRATRMLIIVSSTFVVCNVPWHTARTYTFFMQLTNKQYMSGAYFLLTQKLFHMVYFINFAVNFFLYSMTSRSFRNGLVRLCTKLKNKLCHTNSTCRPSNTRSSARTKVVYTKSLRYKYVS